MAGKIPEALVVVVDVGPGMARAGLDGGPSMLENTVKMVSQLVSKKMFQSPKDEIGLVLFGTKETNNNLADESSYRNVCVVHPVRTASTELLRSVTEIAPGPKSADFIDALIVAIDALVLATENRKVDTRRIVLFTDGSSPFNPDSLDNIVQTIQSQDILLQVAGIVCDAGSDKASEEAKRVIGRLVQDVAGESFSFEVAMQNLSDFKTKTFKQTTTFRGNLEIGTTVKIPMYSYTYVSMLNAPTLKKVSPVATTSNSADAMEVKRVSSYYASDETQLQREDLAKGYKYGDTLVPFLDVDEANLKMKTERRLAVIGFTQLDLIPRHHYVDGVLAMVSDPKDASAHRAFGALFRAMFWTGTVAIVRYVFRANAEPKLGFLSAGLVGGHECMLYSRLPFAEDVRQYEFASLDRKGTELSPEQLAAAELLVTSFDLMVSVPGSVKPVEMLKPKRTFNPAIQRFYQCVQHRALHPEDPIPVLDEAIRAYMEPNARLVDASKAAVERLSTLFPLKKIEKRQEKGAAAKVWASTEAADLAAASDSRPAKRARTDGNADDIVPMEILSDGPAVSVGSVQPLDDFRAMLSRRDVDLTTEAVKQMQGRISEFIATSINGDNYPKALECLRALRDACVKAEESASFNTFLEKLKDGTSGRDASLWELIVSARVTLISADEATDSTVSPDDAAKFLVREKQAEAPPTAAADEEEDWEALMK